MPHEALPGIVFVLEEHDDKEIGIESFTVDIRTFSIVYSSTGWYCITRHIRVSKEPKISYPAAIYR